MQATRPAQGSVISQRFQIVDQAGSGGMGVVFQVQDLWTGRRAALKLLHGDGSAVHDTQRLFREAQVLAKLRHPRIVAHVAHGMTEQGQPYLAMDWLEGEDLAHRLARTGLRLSESLTLLRHVAEALSAAHQLGIIHRDIKPSNIFLRSGEVDNLVVVDFGIARQGIDASLGVQTQTGVVVGTPDYMAPEQARGQRGITPSADLFALGCVLYECLTGKPPFYAEHIVGVLAKILFEEPLPLRQLRPEIPGEVEALVCRLLNKDPAQRPRDGRELVTIAQSLPVVPELLAVAHEPLLAPATISATEQQLVSVLIASASEPSGDSVTMASGDDELLTRAVAKRRELLTEFGAESELLANGALIATLRPDARRTATDQAAQSARMALALRDCWPEAAIALTTGRGVISARLIIGEAIDRAIRLIQLQSPGKSGSGDRGVITDDLTARLLDQRFQIAPLGHEVHLLRSEHTNLDELRLLLGKPTPCVGREYELSNLDGIFCAVVADSQTNAVLVTAPPGMGKSRLRHEFIRRVLARHNEVAMVIGCGDAMSAASSYGLLRKALRRLCGVLDGEALDAQQRKLRSRIAQHLQIGDTLQVVECLGELCGIPFADHDRAQLQRMRKDPQLMGEAISEALITFLRAECKAHPFLLVLEDLHWADPLSIRLLERVLRELEDQPLLIVALARPEVKETFPNLWAGRLQEMQLRGLSKKASERLIYEILGARTSDSVVLRIVTQAAGNALYLEELIRAIADGKSEELPQTVLAMLQSRIARLGGEVRRVLRAGSIFGETFWRGGILSLFGGRKPTLNVDNCLADLVSAEILERSRDSRFPDEQEYRFRHALVRDAAYALLTEDDKRIGHHGVAQYLEEKGEPDALLLAEHYLRGGEPGRAIPWYTRAGDAASRVWAMPQARAHYAAAHELITHQPETAAHQRQRVDILIRQAQFGMLAEPTDLNLTRLVAARALLTALQQNGQSEPEDLRRSAWVDFLRGRTHYYANQPLDAISYCQKVLPLAEQLGDEMLLAIPSLIIGGAMITQGQAGKARRLMARAAALELQLDNDYERLRTVSYYGVSLVMSGQYLEGMSMHQQAIDRAVASRQPAGLSMAHVIRACSLRFCGDFPNLLQGSLAAIEEAEKSGDRIYSYMGLSLAGWAHSFLGNSAEAMRLRAQAQQLAQQLGIRMLADWFAAGDAEIALRAGDLDRALALAEPQTITFRKEGRFLGLGVAEQVWGMALGLRSLENRAAATELRVASEAHLAAALEVMESSEQLLAAACLRLEWAWLYRRYGQHEQAAELRTRAAAQFAGSGCPQLLGTFENAQLPM